MSAQLPRPPPAGGCLASRGKLPLAVQHQRERAMLLSDVDKSRQPAVDKTRAPSGTIPAMPSSIDRANRLCQRSAKKLLRQPDFASVATAIASTVATVDAILFLRCRQFKRRTQTKMRWYKLTRR